MTIDHAHRQAPGADRPSDVPTEPSEEPELATGALEVLTGRMVSLRFLLGTLRRTRRLWLGAAVLGLVLGAGYHLVVPVKYSATATLYLAHPAGSASTVEASNDLAILQTPAVAERAIARLGADGRGLTPAGLLGKTPATVTSGNVLTLDLSGPTSASAVRRVDALAAAYLHFRSQLYEEQNRSFVTAADQQIATLQSQVATLSSQITDLGSNGSSPQLTTLESQRAAATSAATSLQQSVQQGDLDTLSVVNGSRVITPGTAVPTSSKKVLAFDGLTAMLGLLGVTVVAVLVLSVLSDRVRRREDVAALVGAPVALSVATPRRRRARRPSLRALASGRDPGIPALVHHLGTLATRAPEGKLLVVADDDPRLAAGALLAVARSMAARGQHALLVDETPDRSVGRALGGRGPGRIRVPVGDGPAVVVMVPPRPWEAESADDQTSEGTDADDTLALADRVLVIAGVDPAVGAWHLRRWSTRAAVCVTAGRATARRLAALTELLAAAGIAVPSTVLLGSDPDDESVGLPVPASPVLERRLAMLRPSPGAAAPTVPSPALST